MAKSLSSLTFKQLVHPDLVRGLQSLGISAPNSIQAKAIPLGLSGRDVLVCAQTGSGKTFTFLLPILQRLLTETESTTAVIVAPTDQLAHQVAAVAQHLVSSCQKRYKKNGRPIELYSKDFEGPVDAIGGRHLFVGTPTFVSKHMPSKIHMLAIDEADLLLCESQVHESYLDLANQRCAAEELLRATRSMDSQLFLAMAHLTDQREEELLARFPSMQQVGHTGVLVPTLRQCFHYFKGDEDAKTAKLLWILAEAEKEELECVNGATLIFAASPAKVEHLQVLLASEKPGFKILSLHENSKSVQEVSECFRSGTAQVLVATDMSVRGLDFPLVRHVILYDLPVDATAFVHCAGRTARSGNTGLVTCIVEAGDHDRVILMAKPYTP